MWVSEKKERTLEGGGEGKGKGGGGKARGGVGGGGGGGGEGRRGGEWRAERGSVPLLGLQEI